VGCAYLAGHTLLLLLLLLLLLAAPSIACSASASAPPSPAACCPHTHWNTCATPAGVIVNLWLPNWLLALLWVLFVMASNIELLVSFIRYRGITCEADGIKTRLLQLQQEQQGLAAAAAAGAVAGAQHSVGAAPEPPSSAAMAAAAAAAGGGGGGSVALALPGACARDIRQQQAELMQRANKLRMRSYNIEAVAMLYPVLYTPSVDKVLRVSAAAGARHHPLAAEQCEPARARAAHTRGACAVVRARARSCCLTPPCAPPGLLALHARAGGTRGAHRAPPAPRRLALGAGCHGQRARAPGRRAARVPDHLWPLHAEVGALEAPQPAL
jgi:hypothetical protein